MSNIPVTGLSALGAVLADEGESYARDKRQDELLDRQRKQQLEDYTRNRGDVLADVQSTRNYEGQVHGRNRGELLADDARHMQQQMAMVLVNEGLLAPADIGNAEAMARAYAEAQRRGLDKLYAELLSTPGADGKTPLLSQADIGDPAAVAAAKDAYGAMKAHQVQFGLEQQQNAQSTVDGINNELASIRQQKNQITQAITAPAKQVGPNDARVLERAAALAEQVKPGSGRNREAIAAQISTAVKQLNDQALIEHAQMVQSARAELDGLRYSEAQLTSSLEKMSGTFKVAPKPTAAHAVLQQPTAAAPKAATSADISAALNGFLGGGAKPTTPAPAPDGPQQILNPTNNDVISHGNQAIEKLKSDKVQSLLNDAIGEGDMINTALTTAGSVTSTPSASQAMYASEGPWVAGAAPGGPIGAGQQTSDLLKRKAMNDAKIQQLRSMLQGPAPASVTPPAINTPMFSSPAPAQSAPTWWKTQQPAPGM